MAAIEEGFFASLRMTRYLHFLHSKNLYFPEIHSF